jgi:hypothetical protein
MRSALVWFVLLLFALVLPVPVHADDFLIEFTGVYWPLSPSGSVTSRSTNVDLRNDLGITGRQNTAIFRFVFKPNRGRHRINFEASPIRMGAETTLTRSFEVGGRTYSINEPIESQVNIDYFFVGYQYDFINNRRGHAGLGLGLAYFGATAAVASTTTSVTANEEKNIGAPLLTGNFRAFLIPGSQVLNINGDVKGVWTGNTFGWYMQGAGNLGVAVAKSVRLQAGYNWLQGDIHNHSQFELRFAGPTFSLQIHD